MVLESYKAVLCEGAAEQAIMNVLLDYDSLIFKKEELIEEKPLRIRSVSHFEASYLRKNFKDKISIIRILDSRNENFKISKAYKHKINVINIITAPEIEMLIILNEGKYSEFKKSNKKPSKFCKENLKMKDLKSYDFVYSYFKDPKMLISAINAYSRISHIQKSEYSLRDLLKEENKRID